MAIIGTYLANLTNPINIKAKIIYIISFEGGVNTPNLFEYRTPYDDSKYTFGYYDLSFGAIGFGGAKVLR